MTAGVAGRLQAGTYELGPSMNISQIVRKFVSGDTLKVKITIPEGQTLNQIQQELILYFQHSDISSFKIKNFKGEFDFLKDSPANASLEGFLFPDTYFFNPEDADREIIEKFLGNFEDKLAPYRKNLYSGTKKIFEIITMASLLEKEVKTFEDKKVVSGILWKRLDNKMPLQVDATINYIIQAIAKDEDEQSSSTTGKQNGRVSVADTKIDSPYNTYKYRGLPPGPIANPGLESILAALAPAKSDFWYYLSTPEGQTIFSKTLAEHNLAVAKYLK